MIEPSFLSTLEAALAYASYGWFVMPICRGQKRPAIADWPNNASTDPAVIRAWWDDETIHRGAGSPNVGIMTGEKSGLVVIDIDPRNGGDLNIDDFLRELRDKYKMPLLPLLKCRTGGGGLHLYCRHPGPGVFVRSRTGKTGGPRPGVELKADGGQMVVAPPSVHPSGVLYTWESLTEDKP